MSLDGRDRLVNDMGFGVMCFGNGSESGRLKHHNGIGHLHGLAHLSVNGQVTVQIGTRHDQEDGVLRAIVFKGSDGLVTS